MSVLPFELLLALRYLRPRRTFVSVITMISVLGVTLGVAVLIIVISVMSGFDKQLRDKILGFNSHLKVFEHGRTMQNYQAVMKKVAANPEVRAVAPFVAFQVLIKTQPQGRQGKVSAPTLRGLVADLETNISILPTSIVSGKFDLSDRGLLIGSEFADRLNLQVGDRVQVFSESDIRKWEESSGKEGATVPVPPEYQVHGVFDVGYYEYNANWVMTSLEDARDLADIGNNVGGLLVMLREPYKAALVKNQIERQLGPDYYASTWMEENSSFLNALVVEKNVMFYLLFFIMIVAALCILSALITFVVQKTREIGMLKALGAADLQVAGLFLSQGGLIGAIGVAAGYGLGMLAIAYRNEFLHLMNRLFGFELFPADIYQFSELPALIIGPDIVLICCSAWIICLLGGVIPAWRAWRLQPVEALRYE
jgi:lipoprotein-releasing system permease protein